jgi:hypothetical protein
MEIPENLFYATILYSDNSQITPPYFVFEKFEEGVTMLRKYYSDSHQEIEAIIVKQLRFVESKVLPEETFFLLPHSDQTIVIDQNQDMQEESVIRAEEGDPSESIMVVFPEEQDAEDLLCRAFYMGPFKKAETVDSLIEQLVDEPFMAATPIDYVWLYRPTGQMKEVKL